MRTKEKLPLKAIEQTEEEARQSEASSGATLISAWSVWRQLH
jgi:hypothetical protein